jgi:hypothetical protein
MDESILRRKMAATKNKSEGKTCWFRFGQCGAIYGGKAPGIGAKPGLYRIHRLYLRRSGIYQGKFGFCEDAEKCATRSHQGIAEKISFGGLRSHGCLSDVIPSGTIKPTRFPSARNEIQRQGRTAFNQHGVFLSRWAPTCRPRLKASLFLDHKLLYAPGKAPTRADFVSGLK